LIEEPDGVILDHLGDAISKAGRRDEALAAWQRAVTAFDKEQETKKAQETREKIAADPAPTP
jgi:predicted negative regulator of RcsB-dependent stress response